jgi:hypothetical protein
MKILMPAYGRITEIENVLKVATFFRDDIVLVPTVISYENKCIKSLLDYKNFKENVKYNHLFYYFYQDRFINEMSELDGYVAIDNSIEDIWKNFYRIVNFIEEIFEDFKPDIIYSGSPDNFFVNLFIKIAEMKNIKYFWLEKSYFQENSFTFFSNMSYSNDIVKSKINNKNKDIENFFKKDIIKSNPTLFIKHNLRDKIKNNINYIKSMKEFSKLDKLDLMLIPYINLPKNNLKNKFIRFKNTLLNKYLLKKYSYNIENISKLSKKYKIIMLALHYQPEAITLTSQPLFNNQYQLIKLISDILPPNYVLAVKEHPLQNIGLKNPYIYKQILNKKNVVLINQNVSSNYLLENKYICRVLSIGGTIGFEEILRRNSTMVFGDIYYSNFKYTFKANLETIDTFIESLNNFLNFKYEDNKQDYENELKIFLNKYYDSIVKNKTLEESIKYIIERKDIFWAKL